jgi:hypothetical protein
MRYREPLDAIAGAIGGALFGFCVWLLLINVWFLPPGFGVEQAFPFDVLALVTVGAIAGSLLGYWYGTDFFRWLRDHWPGSGSD